MDTATVSTTPSTTTATPPAAAATSLPSESITPGQRPTFEQAFAADAAPPTPDPSAQPEGATTPPAEPSGTESAITPAPLQGPIPFTVHKTALDNARLKATQEAQATFDRDYGWAKSVPRDTIQEWSGIASLMASDPPAFLDKYFAEAASHPTFGPQVKSWAARTLASRAPKAPDLSPDVTVQDAEGREVARTFSADRVQAIVQHAVQDAIGKEVGPLKQAHEQQQAAEQRKAVEAHQAETHKQLEAHADAVLADLSALLDVTENTPKETKDALFTELGALLDADPSLTPHKAAMQLRATRIVAALAGQAQKKVLDDLHKKAASQGMNPASAGVAPTHRPTSFHDASLKWS